MNSFYIIVEEWLLSVMLSKYRFFFLAIKLTDFNHMKGKEKKKRKTLSSF